MNSGQVQNKIEKSYSEGFGSMLLSNDRYGILMTGYVGAGLVTNILPSFNIGHWHEVGATNIERIYDILYIKH